MTQQGDTARLLTQPTGKLRRRELHFLARGNDKVGSRIFCFNLPAVVTCPGMSDACADCYALRGRWLFANVRVALERNWQAAREPLFAERMIREIRQRRAQVVRIHSSGDFWGPGYIRAWARVIRNSPSLFYTYTRSWRLSGLRAAIEQHLVPLPNLRLWYSADESTGFPEDLPHNVRVAWMQVDPDEQVPEDVDLIFRVHRLRRTPRKRVGLTLVCPTNGT